MAFSTSSGRLFLDMYTAGVHGRPGLSVHQLGFSIHYRVHAWDVGLVARNFKAVVTLPTLGNAYIGIAWPEQALVLEAVATPYDGTHLFRIDLTDADIERIEERRE